MKPDRPVRIQYVEVLDGFRVCVGFTDGSSREINLEKYLHGPVFDEIRNNPEVFRSVKVDERMQTIFWDNGADIDPDVLYHGLMPAWMEPKENKSKVA
ncbi:MAG: DUF2442 domain-containing protein [Syntrophobacteraceae bacterium]